ncbi:MAG: alpha-L-fucosidase, partial [Thermoguttaceae bacterium]
MQRFARWFVAFAVLTAATAFAATGTALKSHDAKPKTVAQVSTQADWLKDARIGAFMHFLPSNAGELAKVNDFDVEALAKQLKWMGAKYFVFTLGQNSGYFNAPNAVYDRITGYKPGERCARRDLVLDLHRALEAKGIRLMLYLPCQAPFHDPRSQKAFGLAQGPKNQPIDVAFAKQWAKVIHEWSARYGDKVAGWWFDGGYKYIGFNEDIARIYADAVKRGNPKAIVTFNPGIGLKHYTQAEDYTAGELTEPLKVVPTSRWIDGSQWHALTYLGNYWAQRNVRYTIEQWRSWLKKVVDHGGAVTLDAGPNMNPDAGPI